MNKIYQLYKQFLDHSYQNNLDVFKEMLQHTVLITMDFRAYQMSVIVFNCPEHVLNMPHKYLQISSTGLEMGTIL